MKEYAVKLYKGRHWQKLRAEYIKSVGGLCENCLKQGIYKPGVIVHHIEHVTPLNIDNPEVTLNSNNLMLVCRECHKEFHEKHTQSHQRYRVDEWGRVECVEQ